MERPTRTLTKNFLGTLQLKGKMRSLKIPIMLYTFSLKVKLTAVSQQPRQGGAVLKKDTVHSSLKLSWAWSGFENATEAWKLINCKVSLFCRSKSVSNLDQTLVKLDDNTVVGIQDLTVTNFQKTWGSDNTLDWATISGIPFGSIIDTRTIQFKKVLQLLFAKICPMNFSAYAFTFCQFWGHSLQPLRPNQTTCCM